MTTAAATQLPACPMLSAHVNVCYLLSDFFGDRVFNLESRVHFNEVVFAVPVHQELHGASVLVADLQQKTRQESAILYLWTNIIFNKLSRSRRKHSLILNEPWKQKSKLLSSLHKTRKK